MSNPNTQITILSGSIVMADGFRLRNGSGATGGATSLNRIGITTFADTCRAAIDKQVDTVFVVLPRKNGKGFDTWGETDKARGEWGKSKVSPKVKGGVEDFMNDGEARGLYVIVTPDGAAEILPFLEHASDLDLLVTHETLEIHTPRITAAAIFRRLTAA